MPVVSYVACLMEARPGLLADVGLKFERAELRMIRWMCGVSMKGK